MGLIALFLHLRIHVRLVCYVRSADDEDVFPDELKVPLGRADHILDDATLVPTVKVVDGPIQEESGPQTSDTSSVQVSLLQKM